MTSRRPDPWDAALTNGSQTGLARTDHDAAALLTADDLVLRSRADAAEVDVAELEPATAAPAVAQLGGGQAAAAGTDLLVQRDELLADAGDDVRTSGGDLLSLCVELRDGGVALSLEVRDARDQLGPPRLQLGDARGQRLGPLHDLELDLLELGLAPGEGRQLVLEGLEVLGAALARVEPRLVAGGTVPDELDVLVRLRQLTLDVTGRRAGVDDVRLERSELTPSRLDGRRLGQGGLGVRDLVQTRVDGLQVEQAPLAGRVGFQDTPPGSGAARSARAAFAPTTNVHGSVRMVETLVSTLVAPGTWSSADSSRSQALPSHSDSVAQWPASTRNGRPPRASSRASRTGWCRRSAVMKTSAPLARTSSNRSSPEPPMTATVRTSAPGSPLTRMPPAVAGRAVATASAKSARLTGAVSTPTRPTA